MKRTRTLVTFAAVGATVFAVSLAVTALASSDGAAQASVPLTSPLDAVPGLGKSESAATRDDSIALWEAFRREEMVRACMQERGFDYDYRDITAPGDVEVIEAFLGESLSERPTTPPGEQEASHSLAYLRALYGDDAFVDEEDWQDGRGNFNGGCDAAAWSELPGIWALKERMGDEHAVMFVAVNERLADAMKRFSECAMSLGINGATRPEHLLEMSSAGEVSLDEATEVDEQCSPAFNEERSVIVAEEEAALLAEFPDDIAAQTEAYEHARETIEQDAEFLEFVVSN